MKPKISKFLAIGAMSVLGLAVVNGSAHAQEKTSHPTYGSNVDPGEKLIISDSFLPITPVKIKIDVSDTVKNEKKLKNLLKEKELEKWMNNTSNVKYIPNNLTIEYKDVTNFKNSDISEGYSKYTENSCYIFTSGHDFEVEFKNNHGKLLSQYASLNESQKNLLYQLTVFHEMGHCIIREAGFESNIKIGPSITSVTLNTFFDDISHDQYSKKNDTKEITPISIFDEQFSDVYGVMLLIKKNGLTNDVLKVLNYFQISRFDDTNAIKKNLNNPLEAHSTGFALKEVLKEKNLAIILNPNSNEVDYLELAKEITNKSLEKTLASYNFADSESFSMKEFEFKVRTYLFDHIFIDRGQEKQQHIYSSHKAVSPLNDIGYDVFVELNEKYNISAIKDDDLQTFYDKNKDDIKAVSSKHLEAYVAQFKEFYEIKDADILKPTKDYLKTVPKEPIPQSKQLINEIKQVPNLNAKDVLTRINKIRKDSLYTQSNGIKPK